MVIAGLAILFNLSLAKNVVAQQDNPKQVAQVLAVIVNKKVVNEANSEQVVITRGSGGCPEVVAVRKGVPLCEGDKVKTFANAELKLLYGNPNEKNEVSLGQETEESEVIISSVFCLSVCRWFASLHNRFTNRTQHVAMTNSTTVYEVKSEADTSAILKVYEGSVEVTRNHTQPAPGSNPVIPEGNSTVPTPASNNIAWVVNSLFKMIINEDGSIAGVQRMPKEEVCESLASSSNVEIALHKTPAEMGGNSAKFVNFRNIATREDTFRVARCGSFWDASEPSNFETLGKVYNDWGDAEQATALFEKVASLQIRKNENWKPSDELSINKAIAFRQLANYEEALAEVNAIIANTDSKKVSEALNIRGSVSHDLARNKLTFNPDADLSDVKERLANADQDYQEALRKGPPQRQYIEVNRGLVLKTQGDLARREKRYQDALEYYVKAISELMSAYGGSDNPENKFASLSVAQARVALANIYAALNKTKESEDASKRAENTYIQLIKDAEKDNQKFALAHCGLASLYLISGRPEARENYDKCAAFNVAESLRDVNVPNVVGLRRADAIQVLAEAGLEPEVAIGLEVVSAQEPVGTAKSGTRIKLN